MLHWDLYDGGCQCRITSRVINEPGVGRCPDPIKYVLSLSGFIFTCSSLLSLVIYQSFLLYFSLISSECALGVFLFHSLAFFRVENPVLLSNERLLNTIPVILTRPFFLLRRFKSSNLCACLRTGSTCNIVLCFSLYITVYVVSSTNRGHPRAHSQSRS